MNKLISIGCWAGLALVFASGCSTNKTAAEHSLADSIATPATAPAFHRMEAVYLWAGDAPGSEGKNGPERLMPRDEPATADTLHVHFDVLTDINRPSITPFIPRKGTSTGAAVIVAPGGGHMFLSIDHEGYDVGAYLAQHGVAAFVLKYRLAKAQNSTYKVDVHALMDIERAVRTIRSRAAEWDVKPDRIGVLGFSAGGEIALMAATRYATPTTGSSDSVDQISCKPDFQALLYPGGLNNLEAVTVDKNTPPAFLCCTATDRPNIANNLPLFYEKLKQAGVPVELHVYGSGGHGWGVRPQKHPVGTWADRFVDWMGDRGLLGK